MELTVNWVWTPNPADGLRVTYKPVDLAPDVAGLMEGQFTLQGKPAKDAETLANMLALKLEPPDSVQIQGQTIKPTFTGVRLLRHESLPASKQVELILRFGLPPFGERTHHPGTFWSIDELSPTARALVNEIDASALKEAYTDLYRRAGAPHDPAPEWSPNKREVFISYRGSWRHRAEELFRALGEYEDRSVFIPRLDLVDMQAGNWIQQLEDFITRAPNFVPLLTRDYREGPVARQEVDLALRHSFGQEGTRRLVPVLIDGSIEDYKDTFLGNYHIYQVRANDFTEDQIADIASLLLGTSRNPYS